MPPNGYFVKELPATPQGQRRGQLSSDSQHALSDAQGVAQHQGRLSLVHHGEGLNRAQSWVHVFLTGHVACLG